MATAKQALDPTAEWEIITPETAKEYLETMGKNRPKINASIRRMARDMVNGDFLVTGETVIFNVEDQLADGQNRLEACVLANVPFKVLVVRGVAVEAQVAIDIGKSRSTSDQLFIDGAPDSHKSLTSTIGAAFEFVYKYASEGSGFPAKFGRVEEVRIIQNDYSKLAAAAKFCATFRGTSNKMKVISPALAAAIHYLANVAGERNEAEEFLTKLRDGSNLGEGSAAYKTAMYLREVQASGVRLNQTNTRWALFQKALWGFNRHLEGTQVDRFPHRAITTPVIEGAEPGVILRRFFPETE